MTGWSSFQGCFLVNLHWRRLLLTGGGVIIGSLSHCNLRHHLESCGRVRGGREAGRSPH